MIASSYKDRRWYKEYLKSKKPEFKIEDKSTWGYYMKDETPKRYSSGLFTKYKCGCGNSHLKRLEFGSMRSITDLLWCDRCNDGFVGKTVKY